ncbi:MAG TPA: hypothetical protein VIF83_06120 [Gemmatimonadaceae bacterium]
MVAAESAYLAAAYLSAAMVTLETWKPLRGCLESAAYGYYIHLNPERWRPWLECNKTDKAEREIGYEFSFSRICREWLGKNEPKMADRAVELYHEAIQRGAHFNQLGFRSNLTKLNFATRRGKFNVIGGDVASILYSWRKTLEVGHLSLRIFDLVFADKWSPAISGRIYKLQESIRKLPKGAM